MRATLERLVDSLNGHRSHGRRTRQGARRRSRPNVEGLEGRALMTIGPVFNATTGLLTIYGSSSNDDVQVNYGTKLVGKQAVQDTTNVTVSITTDAGYSVTQSFAASSIKNITFAGNDGNDLFNDNTSIPFSLAKTSGTVSTSLDTGSSTNSVLGPGQVGVFTVGASGQVGVDYVFDGAGYRGQLAIFSLAGMGNLTPGTAAFNEEAARRALSDSTLGHVVISSRTEAANFSATLPWESNFNTNHGSYLGVKDFAMTPGDQFAIMLVPNHLVRDVYNNPSIGGSGTPLYSIPAANPYPITSPIMGAQVADLDGHGSLFGFEDRRLDLGSDRDYDDMTFQITGARGVEPPAAGMVNPYHDFLTTPIFSTIETYAAAQESNDAAATIGTYHSGVGVVGPTGQVGINYLYDGGGYQGQVAIFSLQGMGSLTPGSTAFIEEAARRALTNSVLGRIVISKQTEGARTTATLPWETNYNSGTYGGIKTFSMTPGDSFGIMTVPAGTVWEVYSNPSNTDPKKRPLFSMPEDNPSSPLGSDQFASYSSDGTTFGFEDQSLATGKSDRDYNDVILRLSGATDTAPDLATVVAPSRNTLKTAAAAKILA